MLNKLKIRKKITIFFAIIYSIYLLIILGYSYHTNVNILKEAMQNRMTENFYQLSGAVAKDIRTNNTYEIHQKIEGLLNKNNEIAYIVVYDDEKNIIGKSMQNVPKQLATFDEDKLNNFTDYDSSKGRLQDYVSSVEDSKIGYIRIAFYTKSIYEKTYVEFVRITLLNGVVFIVLIVVAYYISKLIEKPVKDLASVTNEISTKGDYDSVVEKNYSQDFDVLVDSINDLVVKNKENRKINNYLLNKIFQIQEAERKMLSRELHDEVSQSLASLLFLLTNLAAKEQDYLKKERLNLIKDEINKSLLNIRNIAVNLRPPAIEEQGIVEAVKKYVEDYEDMYGIKVEFNTNYSDLENDNFNITIYRIIQECLSNVKKHSKASRVKINLYMNDEYVVLDVADNGIGFDSLRMEKARKEGRLGIYGIRERVLDFNGQFNLLKDKNFSTIIKCKFKIDMIEGNNYENIVSR